MMSKKRRYVDENDDEELILYGNRQALPVGPRPKNFDPNATALTGEEYIIQVVYQRSKMPRFECITREGEDAQGAVCDAGMIPMKPNLKPGLFSLKREWVDRNIDIFQGAQRKMANLRASGNVTRSNSRQPSWRVKGQKVWEEFLVANKPLVSVVLPWFQAEHERVLSVILNSYPTSNFWLNHAFRWFFAVAACLEEPVSREGHSLLRDIARKCSQLRATLTDPSDYYLDKLNMVITIVVDCFHQVDLLES